MAKYFLISTSVRSILNTPWKASWYLNGDFAPVYNVPEIVVPPASAFKFNVNAPTLSPPAFRLLPNVAISSILIKLGRVAIAHVVNTSIFSESWAVNAGIILLASDSKERFFFNKSWYSSLSSKAFLLAFPFFPSWSLFLRVFNSSLILFNGLFVLSVVGCDKAANSSLYLLINVACSSWPVPVSPVAGFLTVYPPFPFLKTIKLFLSSFFLLSMSAFIASIPTSLVCCAVIAGPPFIATLMSISDLRIA